MRVYLVTDKDIQALRDTLRKDPRFGPPNIGVTNPEDRAKYSEMFQFYNYHVEKWITDIQKESK